MSGYLDDDGKTMLMAGSPTSGNVVEWQMGQIAEGHLATMAKWRDDAGNPTKPARSAQVAIHTLSLLRKLFSMKKYRKTADGWIEPPFTNPDQLEAALQSLPEYGIPIDPDYVEPHSTGNWDGPPVTEDELREIREKWFRFKRLDTNGAQYSSYAFGRILKYLDQLDDARKGS